MLPYSNSTLSQIIQKTQDLGFIKVGFTKSSPPLYLEAFHSWIAKEKHAGMSWLKKQAHLREDPSHLLPGCRTIISLAYPYPTPKPCTPDGFTVSRYSQPDKEDYHRHIKTVCKELIRLIRYLYPGSKARICVDSAPLLERSFAVAAGMGFIGKNTMLIIPGFGSYFYLAEILTTARIHPPFTEIMDNQCGACRACIDSCPTGALERSFELNASKCLSYKTIEDKAPLNVLDGQTMGNCFLGCDRCQEACSFNDGNDLKQVALPAVHAFLHMDQREFDASFGNSALSRAGLEKIRSNIIAILTG
jgi:epoxyqueuosine reductase